MKKQMGRDHSTYLVNIRRNKRNQQTSQLKNSLRFSNEITQLLTNNIQQQQQLSEQCLEEWLHDGNYERVFDSIIRGSDEAFQVIEKYLGQIFACLFQRLSLPKAILALHNLCIKSDLFVTLILQEQKIVDIANQLRKLPKGSKQQNVYLSCLCSILQFKQLNKFLKMQQFQQLYYHQIQYIIYQRHEGRMEDNLVIRIVKCMIDISNSQYHFSEEFIIQFLQFFWKAKNTINHINIYMSAISLIKGRIYKKSTSMLISIIRVVVRGRNMLPLNLDEEIPSKIQILLETFQFYNDNMERMANYGMLLVDNMKMELTLHDFMLQYQTDIFHYQPNQTFLQFIDQFCKNGPSELIVQTWSKSGLLEQLIDRMIQSAQICYLSLKVCLTLLARQGSISNSTIGHQMKNLGLSKALEQIIQLFYCNKIVTLALNISSSLQII